VGKENAHRSSMVGITERGMEIMVSGVSVLCYVFQVDLPNFIYYVQNICILKECFALCLFHTWSSLKTMLVPCHCLVSQDIVISFFNVCIDFFAYLILFFRVMWKPSINLWSDKKNPCTCWRVHTGWVWYENKLSSSSSPQLYSGVCEIRKIILKHGVCMLTHCM